MTTFGVEIEAARTRKGLSQKVLAGLVGIPQPFLSDLENDHKSPSPETVQKLAAVLDLSADWLYYTLGQIPQDLTNLDYETVAPAFQRLRSLIAGELVLDISLTRTQVDKIIAYLRNTHG